MNSEQIKRVVDLYPTHTIYEIAKELRIKPREVRTLVTFIRDEGWDLPTKRQPGLMRKLIATALEGVLGKIYE